MINADSFSPTTAVALAEAANAVEGLPAYHPLEIPTMRPSSPVVDTAQNFGQLLLPLLEKVKPFCDLMAAVSKVSNRVLPAFYNPLTILLNSTGTSLCADCMVIVGWSVYCRSAIVCEISLLIRTRD